MYEHGGAPTENMPNAMRYFSGTWPPSTPATGITHQHGKAARHQRQARQRRRVVINASAAAAG